MKKKLDPPEAKRLEKFVTEAGGQVKASILFGISPTTLSRTANRHTAPSPMLRDKLIDVGIIARA